VTCAMCFFRKHRQHQYDTTYPTCEHRASFDAAINLYVFHGSLVCTRSFVGRRASVTAQSRSPQHRVDTTPRSFPTAFFTSHHSCCPVTLASWVSLQNVPLIPHLCLRQQRRQQVSLLARPSEAMVSGNPAGAITR
jgi:hypothetical protein